MLDHIHCLDNKVAELCQECERLVAMFVTPCPAMDIKDEAFLAAEREAAEQRQKGP